MRSACCALVSARLNTAALRVSPSTRLYSQAGTAAVGALPVAKAMEELFGAGSSWTSSSLLEELLDLAGGGAAAADAALDRFAFFFGGVSSRRSSAGKALSRRRRCAR